MHTRKLPAALFMLLMFTLEQAMLSPAYAKPITTDFPESVTVDPNAKQGIRGAWYDGATSRYAHGVLGDAIEPSMLHAISTDNTKKVSIRLSEEHVFEDLTPRLADVNGDGLLDIVTVRSHRDKGAQIAVYSIISDKPDQLSLIASTPYIGTRFRWLAPIGIADLNGDGAMDIAYIDRPHLAKQLTIWSYTPKGLTLITRRGGLTNHRIGEDFITGGLRRCGNQISMITVNANWSQVMKTYFSGKRLISENVGPFTGRQSIDKALSCDVK